MVSQQREIYKFYENLQIIEHSIGFVFYPRFFVSIYPAELGAQKNQQQSAMICKYLKDYLFVDEFVEIRTASPICGFLKNLQIP